jgi:hypothetical protein
MLRDQAVDEKQSIAVQITYTCNATEFELFSSFLSGRQLVSNLNLSLPTSHSAGFVGFWIWRGLNSSDG